MERPGHRPPIQAITNTGNKASDANVSSASVALRISPSKYMKLMQIPRTTQRRHPLQKVGTRKSDRKRRFISPLLFMDSAFNFPKKWSQKNSTGNYTPLYSPSKKTYQPVNLAPRYPFDSNSVQTIPTLAGRACALHGPEHSFLENRSANLSTAPIPARPALVCACKRL